MRGAPVPGPVMANFSPAGSAVLARRYSARIKPTTSTLADETLVRQGARTRDSDSGKKLPARSAGLRACKTGHRPQQGLHGMCRGQVDREAARVELVVTLGV